jgi:peptidoglycan/LPS O-acetylase OafA/YrhL
MHKNNFGLLRLFFATLVIVSHSAEIIDGNRSREALTAIFGKMTFGELAVDAFFLVSGYLIAKSYERSASIIGYVKKRVCRIYPGFLVAFCISVFVIGPFVGAEVTGWKHLARTVGEALTLRAPSVPGFIGLPYPSLNGAMWSIAIEFRCYLFVILFGVFGLYRRRWILIILSSCLLISNEAELKPWLPKAIVLVTGDLPILIRMLGVFCVGTLFYLYRREVPYNRVIAVGATVALLFCLSKSILAESALAIFGGYLIFWIALHFKSEALQRINGTDDISYGVYLYAWPVQSCLVYFLGPRSPWLLTTMTIPIVYAIGFASWKIVEQRFVRTTKKEAPLGASKTERL